MLTNTEKRIQEDRRLKDLHPKIKMKVFEDKNNFFDKNGKNLSDQYEIILKPTDQQIRGLKGRDEMENHQIENGGFMFAFFESSKKLKERFPALSPQDIARLMYIGTYSAFRTGRLQSDNGKKVYRKKDLQQLVGMSPQKFNELFKRYVSEEILIESEDGQLFVNPRVIYRGSLKELGKAIENLQYTKVFKKTVRDLYEKYSNRKLSQLALVYSVIPFLNFETNIVCYNPEETATDLIKPINLTNLAEILDYKNVSKLKEALNCVEIDEVPMFTFLEDVNNRRKKRIIVNPRIIFAGNGESLNSVKAYFNL